MDSCTSIYLTKLETLPVILNCKNCNFDRLPSVEKDLPSAKGIEWYFDTGIGVSQYRPKFSIIYKVEFLLKSCRFTDLGLGCVVVMRWNSFPYSLPWCNHALSYHQSKLMFSTLVASRLRSRSCDVAIFFFLFLAMMQQRPLLLSKWINSLQLQ